MNRKQDKHQDYRGQKIVKYLLLPMSACLAVILSIAFLFHLLGDDTRISGSQESIASQAVEAYETMPLSSAIEQTETTNTVPPETMQNTTTSIEVSDQEETQPHSTEQTASARYTYLPQSELKLYDGIADPRTVKARDVIDPHSFSALVNKGFTLPADFEPAELVPASGFDWFQLHPAAAAAWTDLRQACQQETGIVLYMTSAYRSFDVQNMLFNSALNRKGIAMSVGYNAYQGRSEHQLGLAIDIMDSNTSKNSTRFAQTETYGWMMKNAARFGFILRYPAHKVHITDYSYEPWHFRYVGIELANHLAEYDLTLEEYHGLGPLSDFITDPS